MTGASFVGMETILRLTPVLYLTRLIDDIHKDSLSISLSDDFCVHLDVILKQGVVYRQAAIWLTQDGEALFQDHLVLNWNL